MVTQKLADSSFQVLHINDVTTEIGDEKISIFHVLPFLRDIFIVNEKE